MVEQIVGVHPPREIAGREAKRRYSEALGLPPGKVAAIYVAACQAKTVSIQQPAEGGTSYLDGSIGIPQIYNAVLAAAREAARTGQLRSDLDPVRSAGLARWSMPRRSPAFPGHVRYMSVTGLPNVVKVFDDLEKGKLANVDFLECNACWSACANGNLTVDNVYVSQAKLQSLVKDLPETDPHTEAAVARRYPHEDFALERLPEPRATVVVGDLRERVRRMQESEKIADLLPGARLRALRRPVLQGPRPRRGRRPGDQGRVHLPLQDSPGGAASPVPPRRLGPGQAPQASSSACSRSAIRSPASSMPTE